VEKQTHQAFVHLLRNAIVAPEFSLSRRTFLQRSSAGLAGAALASLPGMSHGADKRAKYGRRLRIAERFGSPGLDANKNQEFMEFQSYYLMYNALTDVGDRRTLTR